MKKKYAYPEARDIVIRSISKVLRGQELQTCLNQEMQKSMLQERDKNLATMLTYNYLRIKKRLDYIISRYLHPGSEKLPKFFWYSMGLGLYEILYLEKIPVYATVNWYVEYIKKNISNKLSKTANAVLRQLSKETQKFREKEFYLRDRPNQITFWSRYYSCPEWIVNLWINSYGKSVCERFLTKTLQAPPLGIRINQTLTESNTLWESLCNDPELIDNLGYSLAFRKNPSSDLNNLEREGLISRQSLDIERLFQNLFVQNWQMPIWDCCAGHGGKTTLLLEKGLNSVLASDLCPKKLLHCKQEIQRLRLKDIPKFVANAAKQAPLKKNPPTVLIDSPCSGLGVLNRRPDIKWKRTLGDLKKIAQLQKSILTAQSREMPSKGKIVYITCTTNLHENQKIIKNLLDSNSKDFELLQEIHPELEHNAREYFYAAEIQKK